MISVAIQGGAMRSIYCLGAIRALCENDYLGHVSSMHTSSAGCVSAALLASQLVQTDTGGGAGTGTGTAPVTELIATMLDRLAGPRFINQRRLTKMVDVDYLIEVIRVVTPVAPAALRERSITFEVALTDAETGTAAYLDVSRCGRISDVYEALRATMAIPVLYPVPVTLGGRRCVDGGIADPLPVIRALRQEPDVIVAISSVPCGDLGAAVEKKEARILRFMPGISSVVRRQMLSRNPLADNVDELLTMKSVCGVRIVRIAPAHPLGSRTETDRQALLAHEALGYRDAMTALVGLGETSIGR